MAVWLVVWAVLLLGALAVLGGLGWWVFTKVKALFMCVVDAAEDAGDAGGAATNWHTDWTAGRAAADDQYREDLAESARPGPTHPLPSFPLGPAHPKG